MEKKGREGITSAKEAVDAGSGSLSPHHHHPFL